MYCLLIHFHLCWQIPLADPADLRDQRLQHHPPLPTEDQDWCVCCSVWWGWFLDGYIYVLYPHTYNLNSTSHLKASLHSSLQMSCTCRRRWTGWSSMWTWAATTWSTTQAKGGTLLSNCCYTTTQPWPATTVPASSTTSSSWSGQFKDLIMTVECAVCPASHYSITIYQFSEGIWLAPRKILIKLTIPIKNI